jgi:hypothetical protein
VEIIFVLIERKKKKLLFFVQVEELKNAKSEQKQFGLVVDAHRTWAARVKQVYHQNGHAEYEQVIRRFHNFGVKLARLDSVQHEREHEGKLHQQQEKQKQFVGRH